MGQYEQCNEGFRTALGIQLGSVANPFEQIFFQDDNYDATGLVKYINIVEDNTIPFVGTGGDRKYNKTYILELFYKSGDNPNTNYKSLFDTWVGQVLDALNSRTFFDLLLQNNSIKLMPDMSVSNSPFSSDQPGKFKKIITVNGYIHYIQTKEM